MLQMNRMGPTVCRPEDILLHGTIRQENNVCPWSVQALECILNLALSIRGTHHVLT